MKGIKREFSVPRTPQQNGIAERKNRTLIQAARTMLADSLLLISFWAEAVNIACYVQNTVLVTKPQNKSPYELLFGRTPSIGFMRHFGCLMTILNTLDPLGKFDGKVDEGFLVRYSLSSKDFRVFNSRTRIIQETLHIIFLENKPNVTGSGPTWLFGIDTLTKTMNYQLVTAGNQSNPSAGVQEQFDAKKEGEENVQQYVLFPVWSSGSNNPHNTDGDVAFEHDDKTKREAKGKSPVKSSTRYRNLSAEFEDLSDNSINEVNAVGSLVPAVGIEAIRLFLAYASFMGFMVYQMDVKSAFLYGTIEEELHVCQHPGFEGPDYPDKVYKLVKALYGLHQAPRACQDKYIAEILRKFGLIDVKSASTPIDTEKPLLKDPDESIDCLPNEEIFTELARMGYEKPSTKLTFYTVFFSPQWKFLNHTILQLAQQVDEGAAEVNVDDVPTAGVADEGVTDVNVVLTAVDEPSIPSPTPPTQPLPPPQDLPSTLQDKISQALEITKLKQRVKNLERRNKLKVLKRIISSMDADVDVTLKDVAKIVKEVAVYAEIEESDDKIERAELKEVVEVVTTAKLMTEVVTAASATITAAAPTLTTAAALTVTTAPSVARRRKGIVIRHPEKTATPSTIIHSEAKSKDKGKGILRKEKEDNDLMRYQALKKKPQTKAQARKNMMIYLRNMAVFKMDYFKGMKYDDIRPIFEKYFNSNVAFLEKTKEQMDEEDSRALKRANESQAEKAAKKQKLDEEVAELNRHLQIVPNDKDDVYTEATPLARKMILQVERRYPLLRFTLDQRLNNVRLEVEEESEVSLRLLRFVRQQQQEGFRPE
uniref:Retrovirus-related Pol polyprotein from transposon TNT 1-94 n=1 Tax=Tanacetum cinerariifolium TaxID=118510 RepID=A0A6L2JEB8_TANCI|nr:retrovirus-related Pol polyprotein from transposon TNT 1-94 [Tanacetum cinerariifolium]